MATDKSILVQKHVRDNSEDLQNEFLDMKNWEEQMKKADSEIRYAASDQIVPPIRKKKKMLKETENTKKKENNAKAKRTNLLDYSSWDKFDADKACEELEKASESDEIGEEPLSQEELEKNHTEATKHKEQGNIFVKQQKWAKAFDCYTAAILVFPYDAVFYANRALCHLKLENFIAAHSDCTKALELDENYVKAYHRRATALIERKMYENAVSDLKLILKLEPSNKEAKSMLSRVTKLMHNDKSSSEIKELRVEEMQTKSEKKEEKSEKIERNISEKDKKSAKKSSKSDKKKESARKMSTGEKLSKTEGIKNEKVADESTEGKIKEKSTEVNKINSKLPDWLPEINEDVDIVEIITKPVQQRSKKPFRTVPIEKIEFGKLKISSENVEKIKSRVPMENENTKETLEEDNSKICAKVEIQETDLDSKISENTSDEIMDNLEEPKNAVQFILTWRKIQSLELRYKYLKQVPAKRIPTLFQDSLESNTFGEILNVLRVEFTKRNEPVYAYVRFLCEVKRFRTLTMFMSKSDKKDLEDLFVYIKKVEGLSNNVVKDLKMRYEIQ